MAPRPLRPGEGQDVIDALTGGVSQVFADAYDLFTDRAGFIADENPSSALAAAVRDVNRYTCRVWARNPDQGFQGSSPQRQQQICGPYLESIEEDPEPASPAPPLITGGQCPGVIYQVQALGANTTNGAPINSNRGNFTGPITSGPRTSPPPPTCVGTGILSNIEFRAGNGTLIVGQVGCGNLPQNLRVVATPVTAEPPGGCGDSGPQINPPVARAGLPALSPTLPVTLPGIGPVNIEVGIDPTGTISIGVPSLGLEGTVSVGGGGGPGAGGPSGARPGSPGSVGGGIAGGSGGGAEEGQGEDVAFGPAPEGRVWVGALVEVDVPSSLGNIAGSGPENKVFPRVVGNCSLTYSGGRGRAYRIESQWTDLVRPSDGLQVEGVRVNVLPSVSFTVYPVSDETCPENTCSSEA